MGLNVLKICSNLKVRKIVSLLTSCAYDDSEELLKEENFLIGQPNKIVESHGLSKRNLFIYSKLLAKQYGLSAVCAIFNTAYGPYDNFDINKTKVVGGLIRKFLAAKKIMMKA
mgnify:FL=1